MSAMILHVNFRLNVPRAEYEEIASSLAGEFASLPGLVWKVWLMNEAEGEAGGTYLFEDAAALKAYLDGPLAAAVMAHPALSEITAQPYEVMEDCTAVTRGPV
jgi:hypothetical protein